MYGARAYSAYLGYGAMRLFEGETLRGHGKSPKKNYRSRIAINIGQSLSLHFSSATFTEELISPPAPKRLGEYNFTFSKKN